MAPAAARRVVAIVGGGTRGDRVQEKIGWLVLVSRLGLESVVIMTGSTRCRRGRCVVKKLRKEGCWTASPRTVSQQQEMGVYGVAEDYKLWGEIRCFLEKNARRLGRKCTSLDKQTR